MVCERYNNPMPEMTFLNWDQPLLTKLVQHLLALKDEVVDKLEENYPCFVRLAVNLEIPIPVNTTH